MHLQKPETKKLKQYKPLYADIETSPTSPFDGAVSKLCVCECEGLLMRDNSKWPPIRQKSLGQRLARAQAWHQLDKSLEGEK